MAEGQWSNRESIEGRSYVAYRIMIAWPHFELFGHRIIIIQ